MDPKISVVLSTYNHMQYLPRAISSILEQERVLINDVEFLIIDDGSTDETWDYLNARFMENSFIKLIRHKSNLGVQKSYYELLSRAKGDYLIFVHSDDIYKPNMILELSKALDENPEAGLAYGAFNWIDQDNKVIATVVNQQAGYHQLLIENPGLVAVLFRRDLYERVGGYDPNIGCRADQDLYLRILEKSKAVYINKILSFQRLDQNCKSYRDQMTGETEKSLEWLRSKAVDRRRRNRDLGPVRILFIVPSFPPDCERLNEMYTFELAKKLIQDFYYGVSVLYRKAGPQEIVESIYEGVKVYKLSYDSNPLLLMNSVEDKMAEDLFIKFLDQVPHFDLFHFFHTIGLSFSLIDIVKKCGYPAVLTLLDSWMLCPKVDVSKCGTITVDCCAKCLLKGRKDQYVSEIAQTYYEVAYRRAYLEYIWRKIDLITIPKGILFNSFNRVGLGKRIQQTDPNIEMGEDCLQWALRYVKLLK